MARKALFAVAVAMLGVGCADLLRHDGRFKPMDLEPLPVSEVARCKVPSAGCTVKIYDIRLSASGCTAKVIPEYLFVRSRPGAVVVRWEIDPQSSAGWTFAPANGVDFRNNPNFGGGKPDAARRNWQVTNNLARGYHKYDLNFVSDGRTCRIDPGIFNQPL